MCFSLHVSYVWSQKEAKSWTYFMRRYVMRCYIHIKYLGSTQYLITIIGNCMVWNIFCVHFCQDSIATTVDCSLIKMKLVTEVVLLIYLHLIIDILPLNIPYEWVSEWLLFNANSANFLRYHGENKLIFNEMMMRSALY